MRVASVSQNSLANSNREGTSENRSKAEIADVLCAWSDGGFEPKMGGTAGYLIGYFSQDAGFRILCMGGIFQEATLGIDSFVMEAIGMEHLFEKAYRYLRHSTV